MARSGGAMADGAWGPLELYTEDDVGADLARNLRDGTLFFTVINFVHGGTLSFTLT